MKEMYQRFVAALRPGTLALLVIITLGFVLELLGLHAGFCLFPKQFWHGRIWTILSYAFIPAGIVDFVWGGLWLYMMGLWLEKVWSPFELWGFCLISVLAAGGFKVLASLVVPGANSVLWGTIPIILGFLMAWARLFGHERVVFMGFWEMSVQQCAFLVAGIDVLILLTCPCFGLINCLAVCAAAVVSWVYLSLRWKRQVSASIQTIDTNRISRLEL